MNNQFYAREDIAIQTTGQIFGKSKYPISATTNRNNNFQLIAVSEYSAGKCASRNNLAIAFDSNAFVLQR
jgi:hypothetical protein